jgi:hypothetical protein
MEYALQLLPSWCSQTYIYSKKMILTEIAFEHSRHSPGSHAIWLAMTVSGERFWRFSHGHYIQGCKLPSYQLILDGD